MEATDDENASGVANPVDASSTTTSKITAHVYARRDRLCRSRVTEEVISKLRMRSRLTVNAEATDALTFATSEAPAGEDAARGKDTDNVTVSAEDGGGVGVGLGSMEGGTVGRRVGGKEGIAVGTREGAVVGASVGRGGMTQPTCVGVVQVIPLALMVPVQHRAEPPSKPPQPEPPH